VQSVESWDTTVQMPFERWGSLSVDDHLDTKALAANVLLYDRLIVPVMTPQPARDERAYWSKKGWDPDLQADRLEQLKDLAVVRPWNRARRELYSTRVAQLTAEQHDVDHFHLTRMILAQEQVIEKPPGVSRVVVVAAYNSLTAMKEDFPVEQVDDHLSAQAYLLSRRLAVPDRPEHVIIDECIALSKDEEFRRHRAELFDWQELAAARKWSPADTVERISEMTERYNAKVKSALGNVAWRSAFTLFGIGLGVAGGVTYMAGAAAALSLVRFAKFDRKPSIEAGSSQPAAMFHDVESKLGIKLQ
jgi:hypothetical protein